MELYDQMGGNVETDTWLERTPSLRYAPIAPPVIERLWALANTPFTLPAFAEQWQRFSWWEELPDSSESASFQVKLDRQVTLVFQTVDDAVKCVIAPLCYWVAYRPGDHPTKESYKRDQAGFDELYTALFETVEQGLGAPYLQGLDEDDQGAYNFAIWRTPYALFIVQQCALNLSSGLEINIWLERLSQHEELDDEFNDPTLIAWLTGRGKQP